MQKNLDPLRLLRAFVLGVLVICTSSVVAEGESAEQLLRDVTSRKWGSEFETISYLARYMQDGAPAIAMNEIQVRHDSEMSLWRLERTDPKEAGRVYVYAQNPDYEFHLVRDSEDAPWEIRNVIIHSKDERSQSLERQRSETPSDYISKEIEQVSQMPYSCLRGASMRPLIDHFQYEYASEGGGDGVIVGRRVEPSTDRFRFIDSVELRFELDYPIIGSYTLKDTNGLMIEGSITPNLESASGNLVGFKMLDTSTLPVGTNIVTEVDITKTLLEARSGNEIFYLRYYGIPEPQLHGAQNRYVWYLLVLAIVFGVVALAVRKRRV